MTMILVLVVLLNGLLIEPLLQCQRGMYLRKCSWQTVISSNKHFNSPPNMEQNPGFKNDQRGAYE